MEGGKVWIEKYRPASLDDLVAHEEITGTITRLIEANKLPHLLFYGPPGTGKTSTILAIAKKLYGDSYSNMTLELNASDDRGIGVVRDQIKSFASTRKLFSSGVKLIILDEADALTKDAQAALRRVIERYTKNTRFCLICNYVNKIIPALQSRCMRFRFAPLAVSQMRDRLQEIITMENVTATPAALDSVLELSCGDMRKAVNVLQATAMAYPSMGADEPYLCVGAPLPATMTEIVRVLLNERFDTVFTTLHDFVRVQGVALADVVTEIATRLSAIAMPSRVKSFVLEELANLEFRLSDAADTKVQLGSLVGIFVVARHMLAEVAEAK